MRADDPRHNGLFTSEEFAILQEAFDELLSQPWFVFDPHRRKEIATFIIEMYRRGAIDAKTFRTLALRTTERYLALLETGDLDKTETWLQ